MGESLAVVIGAVVGGLLALVGTLLTLRLSSKQVYTNNVTSNRMDWINIWRENISIFLANAQILREMAENPKLFGDVGKKRVDLKAEMYKAREMIIIRLNLAENLHKAMLLAIAEFDYKGENFQRKKAYIEELARAILKPEWERLKIEAK